MTTTTTTTPRAPSGPRASSLTEEQGPTTNPQPFVRYKCLPAFLPSCLPASLTRLPTHSLVHCRRIFRIRRPGGPGVVLDPGRARVGLVPVGGGSRTRSRATSLVAGLVPASAPPGPRRAQATPSHGHQAEAQPEAHGAGNPRRPPRRARAAPCRRRCRHLWRRLAAMMGRGRRRAHPVPQGHLVRVRPDHVLPAVADASVRRHVVRRSVRPRIQPHHCNTPVSRLSLAPASQTRSSAPPHALSVRYTLEPPLALHLGLGRHAQQLHDNADRRWSMWRENMAGTEPSWN